MAKLVIGFVAVAAVLLPSMATAASYSCRIERESHCLNGRACERSSFDRNAYFIVDLETSSYEECQIDDCRPRPVLMRQGIDGTVEVIHADGPRVTRLSLFDDPSSELSTYTQATLSSVMTVVRSGRCLRRIEIPPAGAQ